MNFELGFIGAGNMAEAILHGVLKAGLLKGGQVIASDPSPERRRIFHERLGASAVEDNARAADCRTLVLSVKPQKMAEALESIAPVLDPATLVISIAAGISTGFIESRLGAQRGIRVVRCMPNTPMLLGQGVAAIAAGRDARPQDMAAARRLFEASAAVLEVPEDLLHAVTAISGSGPAYFYYLVEHLIRAGVEMGLGPEQAHALATGTALGAARMMTELPDAPQELRRKVTSPNGTTQAAIEAMDARSVGDALVAAFHRAAARSRELGG